MSYEKVGELSEGVRQALLALGTADALPWEHCQGEHRNYYCWMMNERIMFVRIPPGGRVDPHCDRPAKGDRLNYVLQTNTKCFNFIAHDGVIDRYHLDEGAIYRFDATQEHWATNDGTTQRIVMVETL